MAKSAKKFYVVLRGRAPGIYDAWFGQGGAKDQVESFPGAVYKGFSTYEEARDFVSRSGYGDIPDHTGKGSAETAARKESAAEEAQGPSSHAAPIEIYTDGGCIYNPGPGGYGVVLLEEGTRRELSGGYRLTTNNRMELMAGIVGLKSLGAIDGRPVKIYSDSRYMVDGISKGWARKWRSNRWMRDASHPAENIDLWTVLLDLCDTYKPQFIWVRGHAGNRENERCDVLAKEAAVRPDLPPDLAYEKGETSIKQPSLF